MHMVGMRLGCAHRVSDNGMPQFVGTWLGTIGMIPNDSYLSADMSAYSQSPKLRRNGCSVLA